VDDYKSGNREEALTLFPCVELREQLMSYNNEARDIRARLKVVNEIDRPVSYESPCMDIRDNNTLITGKSLGDS
jgi:hypothetical protein